MIAKAISIAKRSTIKRHQTGAVIVDRKGKIISTGWSHTSSHTLTSTPWSTHAECHAIARAAKSKRSTAGATIYVATLCGKSGNITSARPCDSCASLIKAAGIAEVIYTEREVV